MDIPKFDPHPNDSELWHFANLPNLSEGGGRRMLDYSSMFAAVNYLLQFSDCHKYYTEQDIHRTIIPPILCDQVLISMAPNPETGLNQPRGFMTWGWLSPKAESGYLDGTRKLKPTDFPYTSEQDVLWVIDLVAPFGISDVVWLCRKGQDILSPICKEHGLKGVRMRRYYKRTGFFYAKHT